MKYALLSAGSKKKGKNVVATRYRGSVLSKDSFGGFVGYIYTFCHC